MRIIEQRAVILSPTIFRRMRSLRTVLLCLATLPRRFPWDAGSVALRIVALLVAVLVSAGSATAARLDTVAVPSATMQRPIQALVVVPETAHPAQRVPTVYLLHGYGGDHLNWQSRIDLRPLADAWGVLIVCPDGSPNSWYLDSPMDAGSQYETFVSQELVGWIDAHYPTLALPTARAITGLSMGGHGALFLALRHPDVFGSAGSMSGGVDLTASTKRWDLAAKLGAYEAHPERWHAHSLVHLASSLEPPAPSLLIDCGVDDLFIEPNRRLHAVLLDRSIPHTYVERPGGHSWDYWIGALPDHLRFFARVFTAAAEPVAE